MKKTDGLIQNRINSIPVEKLSRLSLIFVLIWIVSPILILVLNAVGVDEYNVCSAWLTVLYLCGGTGLIFGFVYFYKLVASKFVRINNLINAIEPLLILGLFLLWCVICILFSDERIIAIYGYLTYHDNLFVYLFYGGLLMLGILLSMHKNFVVMASRVFLAVSALLSILALLNNDFTRRLCRSNLTATDGYEAVFYDSIHYSTYLVMALIVAMSLIVFSEDSQNKVIGCFSYFLLTVTMVFNNCTSATISFVFVMFVLLMKCEIRKGIWISLVAFIIIYSIVALLFNVEFSLSNLLNYEVTASKAIDLSAVDSNGNISKTIIDSWKSSFKKIMSNSVVGIGLQNTLVYSYNIFLQIAVYTGIPGLMIFLSSLFSAMSKLVYNWKSIDYKTLAAALVLIGYYLSGFFSITMFNIAPYAYLAFGVFIGGLIQQTGEIKKMEQT